MDREPDTWAISDGRAGNARQAEALARALGGPIRDWHRVPGLPWRWFAPRRFPGSDGELKRLFGSALDGTAPRVAIGCGRQAAWMLRGLRRRWPGLFTVQVLDPRVHHAEFDVVVCPEHDGLSGPGVLVTLGALHDVDESSLSRARRQFPELLAMPRPICTVLVGGPSPMLPLDEAALRHLVARIEHLPRQSEGTLLVTTSRRTPALVAATLANLLDGHRHVLWQPGQAGDNPYLGFLAAADRIVVTPDSVNMLSEATAVGVPVYTLVQRPPTGKLARFHEALRARGLLHDLGQVAWPRPPLRELGNVADRIRELLAGRS